MAKNKRGDSERNDRIQVHCEVLEALPGALFKVRMNESTSEIICVLSGRVRQNRIRILPGDQVTVEVSPYDLTRGRIMWRKSERVVQEQIDE